jgi:NAD(P)-dependent dehydrogenase (short-subunit alcohol dehydrogenase family)
VQILINSAGIAPAANFLEMSDSVWDDVLKVNLTGTYNCCKTFLPSISIRLGGSSTSHRRRQSCLLTRLGIYDLKHGVLGLTRSLALETAKLGVTVNAFAQVMWTN